MVVRTLSLSPREFSIVPRYPSGVTIRRIGRLVIYYPHAIALSLHVTLPYVLAPTSEPRVRTGPEGALGAGYGTWEPTLGDEVGAAGYSQHGAEQKEMTTWSGEKMEGEKTRVIQINGTGD